jgi:hypothetical protein
VTRSPILSLAAWLVPDDESGDAILGDIEETYGACRATHGAIVATFRLLVEVVCSAPALASAALLVRGGARMAFRSIPAVIAGHLVLIAPFASIGGIGVGMSRQLGFAVAVATCIVLATAGGWVSAALAGAAPRQHALFTGVGLASIVSGLVWSGEIDLPLWSLLVFQVAVISAATYGGARYRLMRS